MEIYEFIQQLIGNYGFPIAACVAMFWKINQQDKTHKEEMDKMTSAMQNNTLALNQLVAKLDMHLDAIYKGKYNNDDK